MRRLALVSLVGILGFVGLFVLAGRGVREAVGVVRASADVTAENLAQSLPPEVQDRKLEHDLDRARQELIDRTAQLNLSKHQLDQLQSDVQKLEASVGRRKRLLAEAYPILQTATDQKLTQVKFANADLAIADFQRDLDELIAVQERETRQLDIKREGLARLEKNAREGELALADMRLALDKTEQEVSELKVRREQAGLESQTLDMVAAATSNTQTATASVGRTITGLRTEVEKAEARNEARRHLAPVGSRPLSNQVSRGWNRLESLKAIAEEQRADDHTAPAPKADATAKAKKGR